MNFFIANPRSAQARLRQHLCNVLLVLLLLPTLCVAAASDFIGNEDDSCELPPRPTSTSTSTVPQIPTTPMLEKVPGDSVRQAAKRNSPTVPISNVLWGAGGILLGGLVVFFVWRAKRH